MPTPILATKLFIPPPLRKIVIRPGLRERLDESLHSKLALISAPAGFGKTTLVSEWAHALSAATPPVHVAWLSLDEGDNDPTRFLVYLATALQASAERQSPLASIGEGILDALQSPQPPPPELVLTTLLNEIASLPGLFVLALDDYHLIDSRSIDHTISFLIEHLPAQMHLVITTREDPQLHLGRLRARGQMIELRAADLSFNPSEAADFLNQVMGLNLSDADVAALEDRTEGWIAGLQLASLALQGLAKQGPASQSVPSLGATSEQGHPDTAGFIKSFTGSHHFVMDYLVEEVLQQQPENIQTFLLRTSILDRLCGPLCDAVCSAGTDLLDRPASDQETGQKTLEYLEHANLFTIPLDNERYWYRYHPLFADLLRQRLAQQQPLEQGASSTRDDGRCAAGYHVRASVWYEENSLELEAFQHAAAANDFERAARLVEGGGMPLLYRGAAAPVLNWLASLPTTILDTRPSLWVMFAWALMFTGQSPAVEQKLQSAESALAGTAALADTTALADTAALAITADLEAGGQQAIGPDERTQTQDLIGCIASMRATLAVIQHDVETIIAQSRRALEYLHPDNLPVREAVTWTLGYAFQLQGDRAAASRAYTEIISTTEDSVYTIAATICLGQVQEGDNRLELAAESYRRVLQLAGDPPRSIACEAHLGLARIYYQWNDLDAALQHCQQCIQLTHHLTNIDTYAACEVLLSSLKLAQGDIAGAAADLDQAEVFAREHNFMFRMPDIAGAQVRALLRQDPQLHQENLAEAAHLANTYDLPISRARVLLAQGDTSQALAVLEPLRQQVEVECLEDERLKVMVLQSVALQAFGEVGQAVQVLGEALELAKPGSFVRIFVDEGQPMAHLLNESFQRRIAPDYVQRLLTAFPVQETGQAVLLQKPASPCGLLEPLSQRELEILRLIAQGLSNRQIRERLFLALDTVKGHNQKIYGKLQVQRRTEAVARARELHLL
jgi:LuxR family transcriptional regulator, maltose regulon positive regulatory protein